jgi:hypothetical protein
MAKKKSDFVVIETVRGQLTADVIWKVKEFLFSYNVKVQVESMDWSWMDWER